MVPSGEYEKKIYREQMSWASERYRVNDWRRCLIGFWLRIYRVNLIFESWSFVWEFDLLRVLTPFEMIFTFIIFTYGFTFTYKICFFNNKYWHYHAYYCPSIIAIHFIRNDSQRRCWCHNSNEGENCEGTLIFAKRDYDNGDLERNGSRAIGATEGKSLKIIS